MSRQLDDWLERYIQFTQNAESPTLYHLWSGLAAISSALRRKCYSNWGLTGYIYPNLYISLVGPPGGRKGSAMKIAKSIVNKLEIPIGSDSLGSVQALYRELIMSEDDYIEHNGMPKKHKSISIWSEEFQVFLSDRDPTLIPNLTDLFDCADNWKYSTLKRGVENVSNCWITIIGAITPSLLQARMSLDAVGGGLLSRIIFVVGYGAIKRVALPFLSKEEEALKESLFIDLQQIANLSGPFVLSSDFLKHYTRWYENSSDADGLDNDKFLGYNARRALHIKKICMIVSASESDDMIIEGKHFEKALNILEVTEAEMPNAFHGIGMADHANVYAKVLSYIESQDRFSFNDICIAFQMDSGEKQLIEMLTMAERVGLLKRETSVSETYYDVKQIKKKKGKKVLKNNIYKHLI